MIFQSHFSVLYALRNISVVPPDHTVISLIAASCKNQLDSNSHTTTKITFSIFNLIKPPSENESESLDYADPGFDFAQLECKSITDNVNLVFFSSRHSSMYTANFKSLL